MTPQAALVYGAPIVLMLVALAGWIFQRKLVGNFKRVESAELARQAEEARQLEEKARETKKPFFNFTALLNAPLVPSPRAPATLTKEEFDALQAAAKASGVDLPGYVVIVGGGSTIVDTKNEAQAELPLSG
jgi:hypothetical protein